MSKLTENLAQIKAHLKEPIPPEISWILEDIEADYAFFEQRRSELFQQILEIKERLEGAIKVVKSNNEHARKLKTYIHQAIDLCKYRNPQQ